MTESPEPSYTLAPARTLSRRSAPNP